MSFSVALGLGLAVLTAFASVAGFLYKFRGAREAEAVELRRPIHSSIRLFRSPRLRARDRDRVRFVVPARRRAHARADLAGAVGVAGGLVLLTIVADRLFGIAVTRREWIGVALMALGLAFLAATLHGDTNSAHSRYQPGEARDLRPRRLHRRDAARAASPGEARVLAVSAGLLWAASDTSIKALSSHLSTLGLGVARPTVGVRDPDRLAASVC